VHPWSLRALVVLIAPFMLIAACAVTRPTPQPAQSGQSDAYRDPTAIVGIQQPTSIAREVQTIDIPMAATRENDPPQTLMPQFERRPTPVAELLAPVATVLPRGVTPATPAGDANAVPDPASPAGDANAVPDAAAPAGPTPTVDIAKVLEAPSIQTAVAQFSQMRFSLPPIPPPEPIAPLPGQTDAATPTAAGSN
jgi:hypothetical protein